MEHDWRDWNRKFVVLKLCYKTTKYGFIRCVQISLGCWFVDELKSVVRSFELLVVIIWQPYSLYCSVLDLSMSSYRFIILMNWDDSRENKAIIKRQMESENSQTSWCEMKIIFEIALRDDCCIISFAFHIPFAISSIETFWFPLRSCSVWECPTEWVWIE